MNRIILSLLALCSLCACRDEEAEVPTYAITAERMEQLDDVFDFYGWIFLSETDSCLVTSSGRGEYVLKKYDLSTGKVKIALRRGRGPNEYLDLRTSDLYPETGNILAAPPAKHGKLITLSPDAVPMSTVELDVQSFFAIRVGDRYVSFGDYSIEDGNMFRLSDSTGRELARFGRFPDDGMPLEHRYKVMAYQGKLLSGGNRSRFAYVTEVGRVLDIYEITPDGTPRSIFSRREALPVYEPQQQPFTGVTFRDMSIHYSDAYASDNHIYALYSGKKVDKTAVDPYMEATRTQRIEVYDWDGRYTCDLQTDLPILSLCVSSDDAYIIALYSEDGQIKVCRFTLPEVLSKS